MTSKPYLASEDSALLRSVLAGYSGRAALEIGAGNGGNLVELSKRFEVVVGTDLSRPEMADWASGAEFVLADAAGCVRDRHFDLVAFNPPYLAGEELGDRTVEGGKALEVPLRFLREALRVVRPDGKVVMLLDDQADMAVFEELCYGLGFSLRRVASKKMFFEELTVYEASKARVSSESSRYAGSSREAC